ncbi:MAG: hemolysin [Bacteroidetes bacterium]|nr:MAG: hemolysin [Bacteroidota bacterium]
MTNIIKAISRDLIKQELNDDTFVRRTNNGNKEIFIFDHISAPNTLKEIGRLREISFRDAGGGTGKELDIDKYDTSDIPFKQLMVWDPEQEEIVGGYRFLEGHEILKSGFDNPSTPTSHLFEMSDEFKKDYLPFTIELGRSFVQPLYQPNYNLRKGLYSLDNLWDGLGALIVQQPHMKYFGGKFTMYPNFNKEAHDILHCFLNYHFEDKDNLLTPLFKLGYKTDKIEEIKKLFPTDDYLINYKTLNHSIRNLGENIPPMINAYMNLSSTMKYFGTSLNSNFGDVEESGILLTINDIYDRKKDRHVNNIIKERI